jgi:hypothetical protein
MLPAIAPGQQVVVDCGAEPSVGDVALFRFDKQVGVHRIVMRNATWLLTWGDANALPDEPIEPTQVIGIVRNAPAGPRSLRRALLLTLLARRSTPVDVLARRLKLVYHIRSVWGAGVLVFARTAVRAVFRRLSRC